MEHIEQAMQHTEVLPHIPKPNRIARWRDALGSETTQTCCLIELSKMSGFYRILDIGETGACAR
jgi:hypothetical protein